MQRSIERFFVNGEAVDRSGFTVPGDDAGLTRGHNCFDTARTYGGRLFRLERHLVRLQEGCAFLGVPCPPVDVLTTEFLEAVRDVEIEVSARLTLTANGLRLMHVTPLDMSYVQRPLRVVTRRWEPAPWLTGRVKHGSRIVNLAALRESGADEVLWVGYDGSLTEGARSSIFAVCQGKVVTPLDDGRILAGVTRGALIDAARESGIPFEERAVLPSEPFEELYATSTLKELAPIVEMDGQAAPGGGPLGDRLLVAFRALVKRECGG